MDDSLRLAGTAVALASVRVLAEAPACGDPGSYSPPRTPWGDPDLQGIWPGTDMVGVPFERPERSARASI